MVLKTLESPLDFKVIQSVHPKGDQPWYSLEWLMLKLKFQYFGHLMRRVDSFEKTLMLGRIEGRRSRGPQKMRWLDGITDLMYMGLGGLRKLVKDKEVWHPAVHGATKSGTWLSYWTELNWTHKFINIRKKVCSSSTMDLNNKGLLNWINIFKFSAQKKVYL